MVSAGHTHILNARVLRFRSRPDLEDPCALAEDLLAAERYSDARGIAASAVSGGAESTGKLLVLEGRAWYMDRDLGRAQTAFVKAVKHDPQLPDAFCGLGKVLLERGDPSRAARAFERTLELVPHDGEAQRLLQEAREIEAPASLAAVAPVPPPALPDAFRRSRKPTPELPGRAWSEGSPEDQATGQFHSRRGETPARLAGPSAAASQLAAPALKASRPTPAAPPASTPRPPPPASTPRVALASPAGAGDPDDPDAILAMLSRQGIFERPDAAGAAWSSPRQIVREGTRLRGTLIGLWAAVLLLVASGYFGWESFVQHRHGEAARLAAQAKVAAFRGDYYTLVDAERLLHEARAQHPRSTEVLRLQVFVHSQRVLESGSRELGALRAAILRAEQIGVDPGYAAVGRAVMAAYSGEPVDVGAAFEHAAQAARGQPELLFLVGRLQQRFGTLELAQARFEAASAAAPDLLAAAVSSAEVQQADGHDLEARAGFDAVVKRQPEHVRARLWRAFLGAPTAEPGQVLAELETLSKLAHAGASSDRILWALVRARILDRTGQRAEATLALREALVGGGTEPQLLAMVADQARVLGQLGLAQQAATLALAAAPRSTRYRLLLAQLLIERHEGERALVLLANLAPTEANVASLRARASLQSADPQAMRDSLAALEAFVASHKSDLEAQSLRLRLAAALAPDPKLLAEAKALLRRPVSNPNVLRAVGEIALAVRAPSDASAALKQLTTLAPSDPEAHYLLGRARRAAGDQGGAESSLRRALALEPGFPDALGALGALLLDTGDYGRAASAFEELSVQSPVSGKLGLVEAMIGLGRLDDAETQFAAVTDAFRDGAAARETGARLALARDKPKQALELLAPLVRSGARAGTLVLEGDAFQAAGQFSQAAAAYERALAMDATLPEALLGSAELELRAGNHKDALVQLLQAKTALASRLRPPELRARMLVLLGQSYLARKKKNDVQTGHELLREGLELDPKGRYASRAKRALER
jgi:tetratricopeptide (TPR) repeat protein